LNGFWVWSCFWLAWSPASTDKRHLALIPNNIKGSNSSNSFSRCLHNNNSSSFKVSLRHLLLSTKVSSKDRYHNSNFRVRSLNSSSKVRFRSSSNSNRRRRHSSSKCRFSISSKYPCNSNNSPVKFPSNMLNNLGAQEATINLSKKSFTRT